MLKRVTILLLALSACSDGTGPGEVVRTPARYDVTGGGQSAPAGTMVAGPIEARVFDQDDVPLAGVAVTWTIVDGGGAVTDASAVTDEAGRAAARWVLGTQNGPNALEVGVTGLPPRVVSAQAVSGPAVGMVVWPDRIVLQSLGQSDTLFISAATDVHGNPVNTSTATWSVSDDRVARLEDGRVYAVGNGTTHVVAQLNGVTDSVEVVVDQYAALIELSQHDYRLTLWDTLFVTAVVLDGRSNPLEPQPPVAIVLGTAGVAMLNGNELTALQVGNTYLEVTAEEASTTTSVFVTAEPRLDSIAPAFVSAGSGAVTLTLHGRGLTEDGIVYIDNEPQPFTWHSLHEITVDLGADDTTEPAMRSIYTYNTAGMGYWSGVDTFEIRLPHALTEVRVGREHACALDDSGAPYCWGLNQYMQLGSTTTDWTVWPRPVDGGLALSSLAAGVDHACGLAAGAAWCWGRNHEGQLGGAAPGQSAVPVQVTGGHVFSSLSAGYAHTCGLDAAGVAWCWGGNAHGQLGIGSVGGNQAAPQAVAGAHTFIRIAAGTEHTCALDDTGSAWCWGGNPGGIHAITQYDPAPTLVPGDNEFVELTSAGAHSCGIDGDGAAWCWGRNSNHELGTGNRDASAVPVRVAGSRTYVRISADLNSTCALTSAGEVYCWGSNNRQQVATAISFSEPIPKQMPLPVAVTNVSMGGDVACSTGTDALVYCWGHGPTGHGSGPTAPTPVLLQHR